MRIPEKALCEWGGIREYASEVDTAYYNKGISGKVRLEEKSQKNLKIEKCPLSTAL